MQSILQAAGWPIWLLIVPSILSLAIIFERLWSLRTARIAPPTLLTEVVQAYRKAGPTESLLSQLESPAAPLLSQIFAAGLRNANQSRETMKEAIEEAGHAASVELERFLTLLGTIASLSPLLGLFGTVIGMIEIFGAQTPHASNDPARLAYGISVALYNTAFGILVAVPSMGFYRHFRARVDFLLVEMEQQALKLVEIIVGARRG